MSHLRSPRAIIRPSLRATEVFSFARKRGTQLAHSFGIKARIFRLIDQRMDDRRTADRQFSESLYSPKLAHNPHKNSKSTLFNFRIADGPEVGKGACVRETMSRSIYALFI